MSTTEVGETFSIINQIRTKFPEGVISDISSYGMDALIIDVRFLIPIVIYLKTTEGFNFLVDLCGVHYSDVNPPKIGTVYQLLNMIKNTRIRLKVLVSDAGEPHIPSLTSLFSSANWMERETYDFFGIHFDEHPDLRRILNEDQMTYFPMRKEYPLEDQTRTDKSDEMFGR